MAKYDPKRPRPTLGDGDVAPVEALIESVPVDEPDVPAQDAPAAEEPVSQEPVVEVPESEPAEPAAREDENGTHVSDVPVMPPPEEGTANRAVLAAVGIGASILVAIAILLRVKRRRG